MECGINYPKIVDDTFYTKTYNQNRIMGLALLKSRLHLNGKCISSVITEEEMTQYDVLPKHLDGIVNQLRVTKDVEVDTIVAGNPAKFIKRIPPKGECSIRDEEKENIQLGLDSCGD